MVRRVAAEVQPGQMQGYAHWAYKNTPPLYSAVGETAL